MAFDKKEQTEYLSPMYDRLAGLPHIVIVSEADGMRVSLNGDNADILTMLLIAARDNAGLSRIMKTAVITLYDEETSGFKKTSTS